MLFPSKVTSFNESVFRCLLSVAKKLSRRAMSVSELTSECKTDGISVADMFSALDILYALKMIDYINEELAYVK